MSETTNIRSVSTMATWPVYDELVLLIRSLRAVHPDIPLFILAQHKVLQQLITDNLTDDHIHIIIGLEKHGLSNRRNLSHRNWSHLMAHKALAIKSALMRYPNTLFVDCDILMLAPLPKIDETKDLGLHDRLTSCHVCQFDSNPSILQSWNNATKKYRYEGGWIFVNHKKFPHQWWQTIHEIQDESLADERALVTLTHTFSYFLFPINSHLDKLLLTSRNKWWLRLRQLKTHPVLSYRNKPIGALHCHFISGSDFVSNREFWRYLLYKSHSPWFDFINNYPRYSYYPAELKRIVLFSFASNIRYMALRRQNFVTLTDKQHTYKKTDIGYHLIRIYKYLILLPYYLTLETLLFHRVIHKSEFAMPIWKLFIIVFGWTYGLLRIRYRKNYRHPLAMLNK